MTAAAATQESVVLLEDLMLKMAWGEYRRTSRELHRHDLTLPQLHTMMAIRNHGPHCTMGLLAKETNQVSATMTGIINRLIKQGWVARDRAPEDRRKVVVHLTPTGQVKLDKVLATRRSCLRDILTELDEPVRDNLACSVGKYLMVLETLSE